MKEIHIDTKGMTDKEKTIAVISAIFENVDMKKKKLKAKEIRENNRTTDKRRKKNHKKGAKHED